MALGVGKMIKKLTLKNFEVHRKSALEFVPGVNVIAGPSDHGKSSIVRALGLVLLNRPQGLSYVRNTEEDTKTKAVVGAMFDDCEISRVRSKSDNYYTLNGQQLKAMGAAVPDEIAHASRMNELNIQFQFSRKMQHYLLSLSSGEVARYLNALLELDIIDETLKKVTSIASSADLEYKASIKKADELDADIKNMEWLPDALHLLDEADKLESEISAHSELLQRIKKAHASYTRLSKALDNKAAKLLNLQTNFEVVRGLAKKIEKLKKEAVSIRKHITSVHKAMKRVEDSKQELMEAEAAYQKLNKTIKRCPSCKRPL